MVSAGAWWRKMTKNERKMNEKNSRDSCRAKKYGPPASPRALAVERLRPRGHCKRAFAVTKVSLGIPGVTKSPVGELKCELKTGGHLKSRLLAET